MSIQLGRGLPHFQSTVAFQRGHGLGGVLGKFIRSVIPLIQKPFVKNTLKRIGKTALRSGLSAVRDTAKSPKSSFRENLKKQIRSNIVTSLRPPKRKGKAVITKKGKRARLVVNGNKRRKLDIFDFQ